MPKRMVILLVLLLSACIPSESARHIETGEQLLSENFSRQGNWSRYANDTYSARVDEGVYRMLLTERDQYIWGSNGRLYDDTVIEIDVTWQSDNPNAFVGVICRLHPENGRGYYVVVSASGDFSIRYIGRNVDDAIVPWQTHMSIPRSGSFQMRVACVDNFIALYINGNYIDGGEDSRLHDGQIGLALGMPALARSGAIALVDFDNLTAWDANIP